MQPPHFPPHTPRRPGAPTALAGLRVVDFSRMIAGPWCSLALADLGAEVIKIEAPDGDDSRNYQPRVGAEESAFYLSTNRNKKGMQLDLKHPDGLRVASELIARCDIVLENFSNGVMDRLGLGYETLSARLPRLIYCSVSGYGRDDRSEIPRRGYDAMFQAETGFMSMTGEPDRQAMRSPIPIMDLSAAMTATNAILAAVIARDRIGQGQHIDLAMFDVGIGLLSVIGAVYLAGAGEPIREGNRSAQTAPSDFYDTATGPIFITCGNDRLFQRLAREALGRPDLAEDPDFIQSAARLRNREKLTRILEELFKADTQENWVRRLGLAGIPVAPMRTMSEAYHSADARRRALVSQIPHPTLGTVANVRSPYQLSVTPPVDPIAAPTLGQHTDEILRDVLGYSTQQIGALHASGACGPAAG